MKCYLLGSLNNGDRWSPSLGGGKSAIRALHDCFPLRAGKESLFQVSLAASGGFLALLGAPWVVDVSLRPHLYLHLDIMFLL